MPYRTVSPVWKNKSTVLQSALENWITDIEKVIPDTGTDVFFRADDIGYPGRQFSAMINVFKKHNIPLALAVVPCWLNDARTEKILAELGPQYSLWCLHLHGYRHMNTEPEGKKFEFGSSLDKQTILKRLAAGKNKLENNFKDKFVPIFTPPWNRCSLATMESLLELGFTAISRSTNVKPTPPEKLLDLPVNIDLHTRKEDSPEESLRELLKQMSEALMSGQSGFMLHHQRMNEKAFFFIDQLLPMLASVKNVRIKTLDSFCPNQI
ncbi:polysaccharide deacetylase family protein [Maridesulfovibrio bastinii]|uniref:polysaccharide deacetylase family protein n=1 Tax=Maridesulfovibrio bastinii TaxID=47157 RepID=UPI0003FF4E1A|nr:polysaccharide deacetylase family protein [Maridesulfovibrio bastinii]